MTPLGHNSGVPTAAMRTELLLGYEQFLQYDTGV